MNLKGADKTMEEKKSVTKETARLVLTLCKTSIKLIIIIFQTTASFLSVSFLLINAAINPWWKKQSYLPRTLNYNATSNSENY